MNPLLLSALLSFAPGLLSHLFGDPQKKLREQVATLTGPTNQSLMTNKFFQQAQGSPAYSQAQGQIAAGANATQGLLQSSLGARGLGTSGTGAILSSLMPSLVGSQQSGLNTSLYQGAQGQAQNAIQSQLQALLGTQGPSQSQQLFAGGLESFMPFLQAYFKSKGLLGGGTAPAGTPSPAQGGYF